MVAAEDDLPRLPERLSELAAVLAPIVFDGTDSRSGAAARALAERIRSARASELRALERDFRSPRFIRKHGGVSAEIDDAHWGVRWQLDDEARLSALAIGSIQRNGHVREEACRELGPRGEAAAAGLLFLRLNDPVPQVAEAADAALELWRLPSRVAAVAPYLPLLDAFDSWVRTGGDTARTWFELFERNESALLAATHGDDPAVRASALRRLVASRAGNDSIGEVLEIALGDDSPRTRHWAAHRVADGETTPAAVRDRLVPRMWRDANPRIREIALRYLRRQPDGAGFIERAVYDPNAGVRYYARRFAQRAGLAIRYRDRALALLGGPAVGDPKELVGALALLSDNGRLEDVETVRQYLSYPNRAVRREAKRTIAILEA